MAEKTADDTIAILKAVMYGTPKELVPELQTPGGMKLYEKLKAEYAQRDTMWDIPTDDPDLSNTVLHKFDYDAPKRLRKGSKCPTCKVGKLIPIVYGMPEGELIEQSERGEVELGGCVVSSEVFDPERGLISGDPELICPKCEGRFFRDGARNKA
jgi:hypothetical protein